MQSQPLYGNRTATTDSISQLKELDALREKGSITDKEYTVMKDLLLQMTPERKTAS
jgi:hypothetical protein